MLRAGAGEAAPRGSAAPSGRSPIACGLARTTSAVAGTTPSAIASPSHGAAPDNPQCAIMKAEAGVTRIPPSERPVVAIDIASGRCASNQRATMVVAGTIPQQP